uniref:Uncharacterized protein LOC102800997 n=1 Tax=Saccoglossus kowalevskii TaxID=10224 RepID=A0ABM0N137_SACKO
MAKEKRIRKELRDPMFLYNDDDIRHTTEQRKQKTKKGKQNSRFYAVAKGRSVGIFESWNDCYKSTNEYPSALHKCFSQREDTENFIAAFNSTAMVPRSAAVYSKLTQFGNSHNYIDSDDECICDSEAKIGELYTKSDEKVADNTDVTDLTTKTDKATFEQSLLDKMEVLKSTPSRQNQTAHVVISEYLKSVHKSTESYDTSIKVLEEKYTEIVDLNNKEKCDIREVISSSIQEESKTRTEEVRQLYKSVVAVNEAVDTKLLNTQTVVNTQIKDSVDNMEHLFKKRMEEMENKL